MMRWGVLRLRVQFSLATTDFVVLLCLTCVIAASPVQADTVHAEDIGSSEIGELDDFRTWHLPHGAIARLGKGRKSNGDLAMDFSPDGRYLAVASAIGVWVFESASGRAAMLLPTVDVKSVSFSADGTTLASTGRDEIELWHVETGTRIGVLSRKWLSFPIALISPDGATLASGQLDGSVLLWDIEGRNVIAELDGHMHGITSLAFSRNGKTLASLPMMKPSGYGTWRPEKKSPRWMRIPNQSCRSRFLQMAPFSHRGHGTKPSDSGTRFPEERSPC